MEALSAIELSAQASPDPQRGVDVPLCYQEQQYNSAGQAGYLLDFCSGDDPHFTFFAAAGQIVEVALQTQPNQQGEVIIKDGEVIEQEAPPPESSFYYEVADGGWGIESGMARPINYAQYKWRRSSDGAYLITKPIRASYGSFTLAYPPYLGERLSEVQKLYNEKVLPDIEQRAKRREIVNRYFPGAWPDDFAGVGR